MTISHEYAEELGRQIDELEAENERLRDGIARCMFDKAMSGHAQWDEMTEPNKDDWRVKADQWMAAAPVSPALTANGVCLDCGMIEGDEHMPNCSAILAAPQRSSAALRRS